MQSQPSLLLDCTIKRGCITIKSSPIFVKTKYMRDKHLDHKMKESGTSNGIVSYQAKPLIVATIKIHIERFLVISKV
jgi:hypothetical protein